MKLIFISPCYNASNNLQTLVESVRSQSDDRWEHILVDDISTDNTSETLDKLIGDDNRFTLVFSITGTPDGNEELTVVPSSAAAIYNSTGVAASTTQSNNTGNLNI